MRWCVVLFLLLVTVAVTHISGQETVGIKIFGYIRDADSNRPILGVSVKTVGDQGNSSTTTDSDGYFSLQLGRSVKPGSELRLRFEKAGYDPLDRHAAATSELTPTYLMHRTIDGRKKSKSEPSPTKSPTSVRFVGGYTIRPPDLGPPTIPDKITLRWLFTENFPQYWIPIIDTRIVTGGTESKIESALFLDYPGRSRFVGFYLPSNVSAYEICKILPDAVDSVIEHFVSTHSFQANGIIDKSETSVTDLASTGRVYVYYAGALNLQQAAEVDALFSKKHLGLILRGDDWLQNSILSIKKQASGVPSESSGTTDSVAAKVQHHGTEDTATTAVGHETEASRPIEAPLEIVAFNSSQTISIANNAPFSVYVISLLINYGKQASESYGLGFDIEPGKIYKQALPGEGFPNMRSFRKLANTWNEHLEKATALYGGCGIKFVFFSPSDEGFQQIKDHHSQMSQDLGYDEASGILFYRIQGKPETRKQAVPVVITAVVNDSACPRY